MDALRKFLALSGAAAKLGLGVVATTPAAAQDYYNQGYPSDRHDPYEGGGDWGRRDYAPGYAYGDRRYDDGVDTGIRDIAICPGGYHLGRSGRLCWPD